MSGVGKPDDAVPDGTGLRIAVAATKWHSEITDALLHNAVRLLKECGVDEPTVVRVPGAVELPVIAQALTADHDAVVCLGAVVRGGTPHFDYVCRAVTDGCQRVALDSGRPVAFGVLTCDSVEQARARAGLDGSPEDKGREAALAAVETALLLRHLRRHN